MKFVISQVSAFVNAPKARQNIKALRTYILVLVAIIIFYSLLFHVLMEIEGQQHSWLTGFYWTLTVMSTLGFGDITFLSDLGRIFSIVVLLSGVMLLLIMLPFTFIQFFYAPWLEAQAQARAPKKLPEGIKGHVVICTSDTITAGLIRKLELRDIPYCIIEPDPERAAQMVGDGIRVILGEMDSRETYERLRLNVARLVVVNAEDPVNTNILLTIRSVDEKVPVIAIAEEEASVDIFSLSGANYPIPLKTRLGEQLAGRVGVGVGAAHEVGRFKDLVIIEFLVHDTPLSGQTLREAKLRERAGINVVGVWEAGHLKPVEPDRPMNNKTVAVAIGTDEQIGRLNRLLESRPSNKEEVLVIGGGKVGISASRALRERGVRVRLLDRDPALEPYLQDFADEVIIGDASDLKVLERAGINRVKAVALTTNDDAQNIHLAVYCRRLRSELNIISRITRERNLEAIYRAGADFVLSYASLGREFIFSYLMGREPIMVGEGADIFSHDVPVELMERTLAETGIGAATGLVVIAIENGNTTITNPGPATILKSGTRLLMLGTAPQWQAFKDKFVK